MNETYSCKLDNLQQLNLYHSDKVRWVDGSMDLEMLKVYCEWFNVIEITRDYFGVDFISDYSGINPRKGKVCALIDEGKIMSLATVKFISADSWEIGAVSTHPHYRNRGYSKAVCSFIAKYILENNKQAVCNTNINNHEMQRVMHQIGMVLQYIR